MIFLSSDIRTRFERLNTKASERILENISKFFSFKDLLSVQRFSKDSQLLGNRIWQKKDAAKEKIHFSQYLKHACRDSNFSKINDVEDNILLEGVTTILQSMVKHDPNAAVIERYLSKNTELPKVWEILLRHVYQKLKSPQAPSFTIDSKDFLLAFISSEYKDVWGKRVFIGDALLVACLMLQKAGDLLQHELTFIVTVLYEVTTVGVTVAATFAQRYLNLPSRERQKLAVLAFAYEDETAVVEYIHNRENKMAVYQELMDYARYDKKYRECYSIASMLLKLDRNNFIALYTRGECYKLQGRTKEAILDFDKLIKQNPNRVFVWMMRGECYLSQHDVEKALANFNKAFELKSDVANIRFLKAKCRMLQGDLEKAFVDLNKTIEINPNSSLVLTSRAECHASQNNLEKAMLDCNEAVRLDSTNHLAWTLIGTINLQKGDLEQARLGFARANRYKTLNLRTSSYRYKSYMRQGKTGKSQFDQARRLDPRTASSYLEEIKQAAIDGLRAKKKKVYKCSCGRLARE